MTAGSRLGPFEVLGSLGRGGMGEVYRARDTRLKRDVALKLMPDSFAGDAERLARFQREAEILAALNHPNIAAIHGVEEGPGNAGSPVHALVLELVDGETLADRIARGPIPLEEALPIARQIADALEAAHEQGIVHRDLKPANIKVRDDGTVKVLDFGLAKLAGPPEGGVYKPSEGGPFKPAEGSPNARHDAGVLRPDLTALPTITSPAMITGVGTLLGTAAYMSPEQAKGRPADKRSDIWAFGCVLYEMLTGRRAFDGEDVAETLASVLRAEPDWTLLPREVRPAVAALVKGCLRKDRRERIGDIAAVLFVLRHSPDAVGDTSVRSLTLPVRRRLTAALLSAALTAALGVVAVWVLWPGATTGDVQRFVHRIGAGQQFRGVDRPVMALSPDGRSFVYNTFDGLYVRRFDNPEAQFLPGTEPTVLNPFFSPDGRSVGYFETGGELKRVSLDGGAPATVAAANLLFGASWDADGTILFGQPNGIMRVSADGGEPALVIETRSGEQAYGPQLLPDGDSVLFSLRTPDDLSWDAASVVVQSLSTGRRTTVVEGGADARYLATGHLLYAQGSTLYAVPFDAHRLERRGAAVPVVQRLARSLVVGPTPAANYAVADTGTLVFLDGTGNSGLAIGGGQLTTPVWVTRTGSEEPLGMPERAYTYARISPDGTRVALDARLGDSDIWIWDIARRQERRFTFDPALDTLPTWTRDSTRLIWGRLTQGGLNLFWQAADGSGVPQRLSDSRAAQRPSSVTPDGALVLSEGPATAQDISLLTLDAPGRQTALLTTKFSEFNGEVSPDGRWLTYQADESGRHEIWVTGFPSLQGKWQVSTEGGEEPMWMPKTGSELFFLAPDGRLMSAAVEGSAAGTSFEYRSPVEVLPGTDYYERVLPQLGRTYDISPDGRRFLRLKKSSSTAGAQDATPDTFVIVLNWIEELKRRVPTQ